MFKFFGNLFKNLEKDQSDARFKELEKKVSSLQQKTTMLTEITNMQALALKEFVATFTSSDKTMLVLNNNRVDDIIKIYNHLSQLKTLMIELVEANNRLVKNQQVLDNDLKTIYNAIAASHSSEVH